MSKLNPQNERVKRDYLRYLKNARGKSEATLDAVRKALSRFEDYTGARDFKTFRREQAIGFKDRLAETNGQRTGETLSLATQSVTLTALKDFFSWLAWQPGFKSKIHVPDIDYFSLSMKDGATAKATKLRDFPSSRTGACRDRGDADRDGHRPAQPRLGRFRDPDGDARPGNGVPIASPCRSHQIAAPGAAAGARPRGHEVCA